MFYPHASFFAGGKLFCSQGWFGPDAPQAGDRVIVTPFGKPDGLNVSFIHAEWWELPVFYSGDERAFYPDVLSGDQLLMLEDDLGILTHALAAAVPGR